MSQDESDNETLVTKRPDHRAQWVSTFISINFVYALAHSTSKESNLFDAIYVAEREKARAKPGLCPRLPPRRIEVVKGPIPTLEHGSGSGRVPVRIAVCGVSKSWRQRYPDDFKKYAHLIDMRVTNKPDIDSFLEQYPESNLHKELGGTQDGIGGALVEGELDTAGLDAMGTGGGEGAYFGSCPAIDYDGDEESGAILETTGTLVGNPSTGVSDGPEGM